MSAQIRDDYGTVLHITTRDGEVVLRIPGCDRPVRLLPDRVEEVRAALADARAEALRGQVWT